MTNRSIWEFFLRNKHDVFRQVLSMTNPASRSEASFPSVKHIEQYHVILYA